MLDHIICKGVQSKPWLCLKMFLLVMPSVGQKIKQVVAAESIYLIKLQQQYVRHLQRFELTQLSLYQTFERSINFMKPACWYIWKSRRDKCVLSSYVVQVGRKRQNTFHRWCQWSLWENSLLEKKSFYVTNWKRRKEIHQRSH